MQNNSIMYKIKLKIKKKKLLRLSPKLKRKYLNKYPKMLVNKSSQRDSQEKLNRKDKYFLLEFNSKIIKLSKSKVKITNLPLIAKKVAPTKRASPCILETTVSVLTKVRKIYAPH